jgi:hypothetical protein
MMPLFAAVGLTACGDLLDVELPGVVDARLLDNAKLAPLLVTSAIADFECAYNNYTFGSSAMSDEWWHTSGGQIEREWGGRLINADHDNYVSGRCEDFGFGVYTTIHTARFQAEDALSRITNFPDAEVPDKQNMLATLSAYAGYTYVMLGEQFCEMAIDGGSLMEPDEVLALAEERFTRAISLAQAAGNNNILNMARVGLARTRRARGNLQGAREVAALVPEGFRVFASRDDLPPRRWNKGFDRNTRESGYTVAPAYRNLTWKGVPDPRVKLQSKGVIAAYGIEWWVQTKYPSLGADIPLATWEEAQLIIAEAAGGQVAVDIINKLHARAGLPAYDPATDGDIQQQIILERAREFFLEGGHRYNDMLRYELPMKSGVDHLGREYGATTCWPLPTLERLGNPNIGR